MTKLIKMEDISSKMEKKGKWFLKMENLGDN